jgi:hypothetical protein
VRAGLGIVAVTVGAALIAGCGSSSSGDTGGGGISASAWASQFCGPFADFGQAQVTAVNLLTTAASGAATDTAQQKITAAAAGLDDVSSTIADVRALLKKLGPPSVPGGASIISGLDGAIAKQAAIATSEAASARALTGTGSALSTKVEALVTTFSDGVQAESDTVATSFDGTAGGKTLEATLADTPSCNAKLSASPSASAS